MKKETRRSPRDLLKLTRFRPKWIVTGIVLGVGITWLTALTSWVGGGYDNTNYIALSQAIAEGKGFCRPSIPGCQPEAKFPPGYPLLLSAVWLVWPDFPQNVWGFKLVSLLAGLLVISLTYALLSQYEYLPKQDAAFVAALTGLAPHLFVFATSAFSETSYTAFSILALIAIERYGQSADNDWKHWLLAVSSSVFAFYVRSVGIALGGAGVIYFVLKKEYGKAWRFGAAFVIGALPWLLRSIWLDVGQHSYLDQLMIYQIKGSDQEHIELAGFLFRILQNVRAYLLAGLPGVTLPSQVPLAHVNLPAEIQVGTPLPGGDTILSILIAAGWLGHLFFRRRLLDFYLLCYLGICVLWPWEPLRLSVALIPFLFYYLWFEGRMIAQAAGRRWPGVEPYGRRTVLSLIVLWLAINSFFQARFAYHYYSDPLSGRKPATQERWRRLNDLFTWLESNVGHDEVLASKHDDLLYLYTRRHTRRNLTLEGITGDKVDYVVHIPYGGVTVEGDQSWYLIGSMLKACPTAFEEVYVDPPVDIRVFAVKREELELGCEPVEAN